MRTLLALLVAAAVAAPLPALAKEAKVIEVKGGKGKKMRMDESTADIVIKDTDDTALAPLPGAKKKKGQKGEDGPVLFDGKPVDGTEDSLPSSKKNAEHEIYVDEAPPSFEEKQAARGAGREDEPVEETTEGKDDKKFKRR
jgi:hypothetical protein